MDWTLDGVGNWRVHPLNGVPETRAVNSTNEYTAINANSLTYDGNGNVETQADPNVHTTKHTYDADDEQTKLEEPNKTTVETGYDAAGDKTVDIVDKVVNGQPEKHPEGAYYLEWREHGRRVRLSVGKDAQDAAARRQRKQATPDQKR